MYVRNTGLQAYSLMRDAACLVDQSTNAYCYVSATHNPNPSDLYFYQLPLGISLPSTTEPSCSACTKSLMQLFSLANNVTALEGTYGGAAAVADGTCGEGYVKQTLAGSGGARGVGGVSGWVVAVVVVGVVVVGGGW